MRILDTFCGDGGAGKGYADAGFEVVGVDIEPRPNYPFAFVQMNALEALFRLWMGWPIRDSIGLPWYLKDFDAIHASPPCQAYSATKSLPHQRGGHPDLVEPTRRALKLTGLPWVIENVPRSPLNTNICLCGSMFGLRVFRHRWFEASFLMFQPQHVRHDGTIASGDYFQVVGNGRLAVHDRLENWQSAMGIDWMPRRTLTQAIPPAYTEYIGSQLMDILERIAA